MALPVNKIEVISKPSSKQVTKGSTVTLVTEIQGYQYITYTLDYYINNIRYSYSEYAAETKTLKFSHDLLVTKSEYDIKIKISNSTSLLENFNRNTVYIDNILISTDPLPITIINPITDLPYKTIENPSGYESCYDAYPRYTSDAEWKDFFKNPKVFNVGCNEAFIRVFIPPGLTYCYDFHIVNKHGRDTVNRLGVPPQALLPLTNEMTRSTNYDPANTFKEPPPLKDYSEKDIRIDSAHYMYESGVSLLWNYVCSFGLPSYRAGWFYIHLNKGSSEAENACNIDRLSIAFNPIVDVNIYNTWWDTYIYNASKKYTNWNALVENVTEYKTGGEVKQPEELTVETSYVSLHADYSRIDESLGDENGDISIGEIIKVPYAKELYLKAYVPPGLKVCQISTSTDIYWKEAIGVVNYKSPPTKMYSKDCFVVSGSSGNLLVKDQDTFIYSYDVSQSNPTDYPTESYIFKIIDDQGSNMPPSVVSYTDGVSDSDCGWVYFYIRLDETFKEYSTDSTVSFRFDLLINIEKYNKWFDEIGSTGNYINNEDDNGDGGEDDDDNGGGEDDDTPSAEPHPDWPPCDSVVPPASVLASEFYNLQDLNGDGKIYGYDFKITDDNHKPPWKPIVLILLENSPYWANPSLEQTWLEFLESLGFTSSGGSSGGGSGGGSGGSSSSGGSSVVNGYTISLMGKFDKPYLWHLTNIGSRIYSGAYRFGPSYGQSFYYFDPPYDTIIQTSISNSNGDESSRVYNFNGTLYVTTEGGKILVNGSSLKKDFNEHFLMAGCRFNNKNLVAYCPAVDDATSNGMQIYEESGNKWGDFDDSMFAFDMCEYNNELYVVGGAPGALRTDTGRISKFTKDGKLTKKVVNNYMTMGCCCVFDSKLFFGCGQKDGQAKVGYYDGSTTVIEYTFSNLGSFGDLCVFNNCLFATVFPISAGQPEVWRRKDGEWAMVVSQSDFRKFGTPGFFSNLICWTGAMTVVDDKLYFTTVDSTSEQYTDSNSGNSTAESNRSGPSYLFCIEVSGEDSNGGSSGGGSDAINISEVASWSHTDVSDWTTTKTLNSISYTASTINLSYTDTSDWASKTQEGVSVNANAWVFVNLDGVWHAGCWEFLRPNQSSKDINAVNGPTNIKNGTLASWKPKSGESYGFMISGLCRNGLTNVSERSNIIMSTWP